MDIQLLMRLERMAQPRWLTLSADVAAAKRLVASGMIEATLETQFRSRAFSTEAVHVHAVTREAHWPSPARNPARGRKLRSWHRDLG